MKYSTLKTEDLKHLNGMVIKTNDHAYGLHILKDVNGMSMDLLLITCAIFVD